MLWEGLRAARRRLVITDDRIDQRTANASVVRSIRERRTAGAVVHLVHPEVARADRATESIASLRTGPGRVQVRIGRESGRVVIADDEVMIGSFSPLGDKRSVAAGHRVSHVGLRIREEALAADLAALLGAASTEAEPAMEAAAPTRRPRRATKCRQGACRRAELTVTTGVSAGRAVDFEDSAECAGVDLEEHLRRGCAAPTRLLPEDVLRLGEVRSDAVGADEHKQRQVGRSRQYLVDVVAGGAVPRLPCDRVAFGLTRPVESLMRHVIRS